MGEIKIVLPDDVEKIFRKEAMRRYGYIKGALSQAVREAIREWSNARESKEDMENPIESMRGILKHVKKGSVELQHEAWDDVVKKHLNRSKKKK